MRASPRAVGQQRHLAGVLHGSGNIALVLGAVARHAPRPDLSPLGHELLQQAHVLVVDVVDPVLAEDADLALLLLLPALVILLSFRSSLGLSRHPAVTPLLLRRPPPRAPRPSPRRRRPNGSASRPWPWPNAATGRSRRPRSPRRCACRPPGSP